MTLKGKITLENSLFLFRHIVHGQVVPSRSNVLKLDGVWKHLKEPYHKLRKDHWKPIAVLSGFEHLKTADIVWHSLYTYPNELRDDAWLSLPKRIRRVQELNQAEHKITALCRILNDLPNYYNDPRVFPEPPRGDLELKMLWETDYYKKLPEKKDLSWPEFIKHDKLDLIRGRNIANLGLKTTQSGKEYLIKLSNMHKERIQAKESIKA